MPIRSEEVNWAVEFKYLTVSIECLKTKGDIRSIILLQNSPSLEELWARSMIEGNRGRLDEKDFTFYRGIPGLVTHTQVTSRAPNLSPPFIRM